MREVRADLKTFFNPESVAIVGVSSDFSKFTGRTLKYLLKHGYKGKVYPINPKYREIANLRCYPSVSDLPEAADIAFIQIREAQVMSVLQDCSAKGIRNTVIFSAGLGETGPEGRRKELEIKDFAHAHSIRICGPNSVGYVNTVNGVALSPVVALELDSLPSGRIGLISQSGGMTGALISRAEARGIGFSYIISTGNEADLGVSDFLRFMVEDPYTRVISLFLEAIRQPEEFLKTADMALERGKALVCLKIGKADVGVRAAASHTGALTGSDEIYEAIFRKKGITRVEALEDLFETASLFEKYPAPKGNRIGIVTTTGGGATLLADECGALGLDFPNPSGQTLEALGEGLPSFAAFSNPLDVTGSGVGGGYERALNFFLKDDQFDVVVSVVGTSSQFAPEMGVKPILRREKGGKKPLVAFLNPNAEAAARLLEQDGIPTFRTPEGCARGLKYFWDWGSFLEKRRAFSNSHETFSVRVDEREVDEILRGSPPSLNEFDSKRLLRLYGIPAAREELAYSPKEAARIAQDIGYPVVLKACSSEILHKTDARLVKMGIGSEAGIREAFEDILSGTRRYKPSANIAGVLVQETVQGGQEVIIGMSRDRAFGPILIFGMGGIFVELLKDVSMRIPPLTRSEAEEMVMEVKTAPLLEGYRGGKARDIEALVDVILRFSRFSTDLGPKLKTAEINPLMVLEKGKGVKAVDALVVKADGNVSVSE